MQPVHEYDYSTLKWVKGEIDESLKAAREALEGYFEDDDPRMMRICLDRLHEVQGTLHVLDIQGAALLSSEMEETGQALLAMADEAGGANEDRREAIIESLMGAMLRLPGYLERVQEGHRDIPAALLPVFNDLRQHVGRTPLTEADLFRPSLNVNPPHSNEPSSDDPRSLARHLRPEFQSALVAWLRKIDRSAALKKFEQVFRELGKACVLPEAARLWWVASGFVEALHDNGIDDAKQVNPLFPKLDRQLKLLQDRGEAALDNPETTTLTLKMLYLVGRSTSHGTRVEDLRSAFALDQLLPSKEEIQEFEGSLSGATITLMDTVAEALRDDLHAVMEPLDVFTRSRDRNIVELRSLAQRLDDIADTLAMLGVAAQKEQLQTQSKALVDMVTGELDVTNETLSSVARGLLMVEQALGGIDSTKKGADAPEKAGVNPTVLTGSVMHEARINLEAIKEQVIEFIAAGGRLSVRDALRNLDEVRGSLVILGQQRAADIVLHCENYLNGAMQHGDGVPEKQQIESFAEAISGLEYYLEAVDEGLGGQKQILESIERALASLPEYATVATPITSDDTNVEDQGKTGTPDAVTTDLPSAIPLAPIDLQVSGHSEEADAELSDAIGPNDSDGTAQPEISLDSAIDIPEVDDIITLDTVADEKPAIADPSIDTLGAIDLETNGITVEEPPSNRTTGDTAIEPPSPKHTPTDITPPTATQAPRFEMPKVAVEHDADEELVEIFIEEASEEIDSINRTFPEWQSAPDNHDSLANLRRSFHTLKGSGRMVGAWLMGEYAWAFENMFNGVLDGSISASPDMFRLVKAATDTLPQLVDQLQTGVAPSTNIEAFMDGAWALQGGEPLPSGTANVLAAFSPETGISKEPEPVTLAVEEPEGEPEEQATEVPMVAMATQRDPVLMEIFKEEAEGHIDTIRNYVSHARGMSATERLVSDDLLRALHTIHGSGRMAEVNEIADLAGKLEHYVKDIAASRHPLDDDAIDLLEDSASALDEAMESIDFNTDLLPHRQELFDRLAGIGQAQPQQAAHDQEQDSAKTHLQEVFLSDAADILQGADETFKVWRTHPEEAKHLSDLLGDLDTLADGSKLAGNDALSELAGTEYQLLKQVSGGEIDFNDELADLLAQTHDRLWALLESSREGIAAPEDEQLANRLKAATTVDVQAAADESTATTPKPEPTPEAEAAAEAAAAAPPATKEEPKATVSTSAISLQTIPLSFEDSFPSDVDLELLEAFLEEGEDLLGVADTLITRLSKDPSDSKSMGELRRSMHTVKGGARMVGLMTMGNLSHALESMVQAIVDGELPPSEQLFDLLQMSHDTMANMLERARDAKPLPRVDVLIQRIEGILSGKSELGEVEKPVETGRKEMPPVEANVPAASKPEPAPAPKTAADRRDAPRPQQEQIRVRADLLNQLVNFAGEVSISRSRIEEQISGFRFNLQELDQTIIRLRQQLRKLEVETEAQILFRHEQDVGTDRGDFDPLEMDRYSTVQQLSRQLLESVSDFVSLHGILLDETREAETLLLQQSRVNTELQEGLIRTRMVPFSGLAPRLRRIVRQTSKELGKKIELRLEGAATEVDRTVLDRMISPIEHLLRNSVNHGIETPKQRKQAGKSTTGLIRIALTREGQEVVISIYDDGRGLDLSKIRRKAVANGLMKEGAPLSDKEVMHFILESGFTTASAVTQIAGRGVGMDVVSNEIKQLSGNLEINSLEGRSTTFTIRLPLTLSVSQALLVTVHDQNYAIPLSSIESVIQLSKMEADKLYTASAPRIERGDRSYQFVPLPLLLDQPVTPLQNEGDRLPVLLFTAGETSVALSVDALLGVQEIVVKSVGPQLGRIREISGATILGDGRVVLIMDMGSLLRKVIALHGTVAAADHLEMEEKISRDKIRVLVVDDSITVRKITQRLLERNNMSVVTAKDGVDATTLLLEDEEVPDIIVTDIEMPRMDGYELATLVRNDTRLSDIPIIMITSRTGIKHRDRAEAVGVNRYLGKPFQESDLLATITSLMHTDNP